MDDLKLLQAIESLMDRKLAPINERLEKLEQGQAKLEQGQEEIKQHITNNNVR